MEEKIKPRPAVWPQPCRICGAFPEMSCTTPMRATMKEVHRERMHGEYGDWTIKFDALYRDRELRFCTKLYARSAA